MDDKLKAKQLLRNIDLNKLFYAPHTIKQPTRKKPGYPPFDRRRTAERDQEYAKRRASSIHEPASFEENDYVDMGHNHRTPARNFNQTVRAPKRVGDIQRSYLSKMRNGDNVKMSRTADKQPEHLNFRPRDFSSNERSQDRSNIHHSSRDPRTAQKIMFGTQNQKHDY